MMLTTTQALAAIAEIEAETAEWTASRFFHHTRCADKNIVVRLFYAGFVERRPGHMYRSVPGARVHETLKTRIVRYMQTGAGSTAAEIALALDAMPSSVRLVMRGMVRQNEIHLTGYAGRTAIFKLGPGSPDQIKAAKPKPRRKASPKKPSSSPAQRDVAASWF